MSDPVSSISTYLLTNSYINNNQTQINTLSAQLSTGQTATSLADYGSNAQTVLNLASSTQTENAYVQNNTVVGTYLGAYSDALSQLQSDTTTLQGALQAFSINNPSSVANLSNVLNGVMTDVSATLNSQVGSRFLFAGTGSRLETPPVTDNLASLLAAQTAGLPATGLPATAPTVTSSSTVTTTLNGTTSITKTGFTAASATNGTLPFYDSQYAAATSPTSPPSPTSSSVATNTAAYGTQTVTASDNQQITFGISSNDPTFQALIYSIQNAYYAVKSAQTAALSSTSTAEATALQANANTYVSNASEAASVALNGGSLNGTTVSGLTDLEEEVGDTQSTLKDIGDVQTQTLSNLATQTSSLESVNSNTVAEEITALENQLNASYKVTASIMNLSLLTYL